MSRYVNFNTHPVPEDSGIISKIMSAGSMVTSNKWIIMGIVGVIIIVGIVVYYFSTSTSNKSYSANSEHQTKGQHQSGEAELLFFFADWCPHCKSAKPYWNDLKDEYENKPINGYRIIFTEIDCSNQTAEAEKWMDQYNVEGFPTIKLTKDNQVIDFDAKPTKETLTKFLETVV